MVPNDNYLCLLATRGSGRGWDCLFLLREAAAMLSIVLSKAFLFAADDSITDPTIVRQIRH